MNVPRNPTGTSSTPRIARAAPLRTCVGCRKVVAQGSLVRLVVEGGAAVVDEERRMPGRGAWVHPVRGCLHNAARGGLQRSFRRSIDPAALVAWGQSNSPAGDQSAGGTKLVIATEKS